MAERRAAGFNIPLDFYDGPEVKSIPRRIRAAAVGVWALCGNYSATKLTDGYVDAETLRQFGCTDAIRAAMKATMNGRGERSPLWTDARERGIQLTNWRKWQRTNDEVKAYRTAEAERKKKAREAYKSGAKPAVASADSEMSARTSAGQDVGVPPDVRSTKTEAETKPKPESLSTSLVTSGVCVQSIPGGGTHTRFCRAHPNGTTERCGDCANARKAFEATAEQVEADDLARQRAARAETAQALADCPLCDDAGWILGSDGLTYDPAIRCLHPKAAAHA